MVMRGTEFIGQHFSRMWWQVAEVQSVAPLDCVVIHRPYGDAWRRSGNWRG